MQGPQGSDEVTSVGSLPETPARLKWLSRISEWIVLICSSLERP